jgi:hypothetical protein
MLPHLWMEKVCVTAVVSPPVVADCSMFKECEQVNSSKTLHYIFATV